MVNVNKFLTKKLTFIPNFFAAVVAFNVMDFYYRYYVVLQDFNSLQSEKKFKVIERILFIILSSTIM